MKKSHSHDIRPDKNKAYFVIETETKLPFKLESSKLTQDEVIQIVSEHPNIIAATCFNTLTIIFIPVDEFKYRNSAKSHIFSTLIINYGAYPKLKKIKNFHHRKSILIVKQENKKKSKKFKISKRKEITESFIDKMGLSIRCSEDSAKEICEELANSGILNSVNNNRCAKYYRNRYANSKGVIELQTNRTIEKFAPLKVLINPSKANASELLIVFKTIKNFLGEKYSAIMSNSIISRLDIAQNWFGYSCEDFTLGLYRSTNSTAYVNANGRFESKIVGRGRKRFHIYLKRVGGKNCLRVELQLSHARHNDFRISLSNFNDFYHFVNDAFLYESLEKEKKFSDIVSLSALQNFGHNGLRRFLLPNDASSLNYYLKKNKHPELGQPFFLGAMKELKKLVNLILKA